MKRSILIVEDNFIEVKRAERAAKELKVKYLLANNLESAKRIIRGFSHIISGVVTDIYFPLSEEVNHPNQPNGLAVVAESISIGLPTVVCSDVNHHSAYYICNVLQALEKIPSCPRAKIPVCDNRDWRKAILELINLIKQ